MKVDVFVMHTICVVHSFFLDYMKCSFFRYYMCVFDINLFILNEEWPLTLMFRKLRLCVLPSWRVTSLWRRDDVSVM